MSNTTLTSLEYVARALLCAGGPVSSRASLTLLSSLQPVCQPDRARGRRGALEGVQEQHDADVARVSRTRPAPFQWPCLATSFLTLYSSLQRG
jgi:hypothetical protein